MQNRPIPVQKTPSLEKEDKEMLNIIGQAMMIATRMDSPQVPLRAADHRAALTQPQAERPGMRVILLKVARLRF